jgi:hypothetical protein
MKETALRFTIQHSRLVVLLTVVALLLLVGAAGEVAAHNPAGVSVPACEKGAEAAAHSNPTCHG